MKMQCNKNAKELNLQARISLLEEVSLPILG